MVSTTLAEPAVPSRAGLQPRHLYVAWQDPESRAFVPVGRIGRDFTNGDVLYEYRYLRVVGAFNAFDRSSDSPGCIERTNRRSCSRSSRTE
jgi:hypothetical protein